MDGTEWTFDTYINWDDSYNMPNGQVGYCVRLYYAGRDWWSFDCDDSHSDCFLCNRVIPTWPGH